MQAPDLLDKLRDIHLPQDPSLWPLAPGWYILGFLLIISTLFISTHLRRYFKQHRLLRYSLGIINDIKMHYEENKDIPESCASISQFFKKIVIKLYPQQNVETLYGDAWLMFLNKTGNTMKFQYGVGKVLATAPYQKESEVDMSKLFKLSEQWVKEVIKNV